MIFNKEKLIEHYEQKGYSKEEAIFIASCELARQTLFMYKNKIGIKF